MRPILLDFSGINSFSEPAHIDFEKLLSYGIFGIFGDTGSGKSTILDCIGFALYGNIARSRSGSIADVINFSCERAFVNFEFEISYGGKRRIFRVERELKRKNAAQACKVFERTGDKFAVIKDGVRDCNAFLLEVIGLEQRDFEKCIALPQGEFAQFVRSTRADRLKLVSRLFDLEEYGDQLVRRANARYAKAEEERRLSETRLEPFSDVSAEHNEEVRVRLKTLEEQERLRFQELERTREEEKRLSVLYERAREQAALEEKRGRLDALRPEMQTLERELFRIERAAAAVTAEKDRARASRELTLSEEALAAAKKRLAAARQRTEELSRWDEKAADEELSDLQSRLTLSEQAEKQQKRRKELEVSLTAARNEYAEEFRQFKGFSYETERAALENRGKALGSGDYLAFLEEKGKAALLKEEYRAFAAELIPVYQAHPEAEELAALIRKYTALSEGKEELTALREEYLAREEQRKLLNEELLKLERKAGLYKTHLERLMNLQERGVRIKEELEGISPPAETGSLSELQALVLKKKRERAEMLSSRERAGKELSAAETGERAAEEKLALSKTSLKEAETRAKETLEAAGLASADEALSLTRKYGDGKAARDRLEAFKAEDAAVLSRLKDLETEDLSEGTKENVEGARALLSEKQALFSETAKAAALARDELKRGEEALEKKRTLEAEHKKAVKRAELQERLKKLLEGNKFMDFVAEEYLHNVAENAGGRLLSLTDGRYFLKYEGGAVGFTVGDNLNGGRTRGVYTLSGGETFLVSLSLALSLSQEICLRSLRPIEFFFLDEGFGTLDERLVDTVMDSLERLKSENFCIGIISHVEELKHRIDKKLIVKKATETHGSEIIAE